MPNDATASTRPTQSTNGAGIHRHLPRLPPIHGRSVRSTLRTAPMRDPRRVDLFTSGGC